MVGDSLVLNATPIDIATANTGEGAKGRIEWLDFLRGAASLAIVLFHVRVTLWVGWRALMTNESYAPIDRALAWITLPFPFFGTTVMLFFVVSGFAIHYPYARLDAKFAAGPYALRRFFRIYPVYLAAVLLTVAAEHAAASIGTGVRSTWSKVVVSAAMAQNYVPPAGQLVGNPSLWSLPVEVELYLVYPLLLWMWRRTGTAAMLIVVTVVSAGAALILAAGYDWPIGNFAKYWIIWTSGAVLAQQVRTGSVPSWHSWYGLLLLIILALAIGGRVAGLPYGFEHFLWGGIYYLVTLWGLNRTDPLRLFPPTLRRAGLFLGDISYSLYLIHFPLFLVLGAWWVSEFDEKPVSVLIPLAAAAAALPVAYLLWKYVERPSQALGRKLSTTPPVSVPASQVLAV